MGHSKSLRQAQGRLSARDRIDTIYPPRRHKLSAASYRLQGLMPSFG